MALSLTGCTGGSAANQGDAGTPSAGVASAGPDSTQGGNGAGTLQVAVTMGIQREALDALRDGFEAAHPGSQVVFEFGLQGQLVAPDGTLHSRLQGADLAIFSNPLQLPLLVEHGHIRDLTNLGLPPSQPAVASVYDSVAMVAGRRYGVPYIMRPLLLSANPEKLTAAGLSEQLVDWDLTQLSAFLEQAQRVGVSATGLLGPVVRSFGGRLYDPDAQQYTLDQAETQAALAWLAGQVQSGRLPVDPEATGGPGGMPDLFGAYWDGQGAPSGVWQPLPRGPRGRAVPVRPVTVAILSNSDQPELAGRFLAYLLSLEGQLILARTGVYPVTGTGDDLAAALQAWRSALDERTATAVELSLAAGYYDGRSADYHAGRALIPYFQGEITLDQVEPEAP